MCLSRLNIFVQIKSAGTNAETHSTLTSLNFGDESVGTFASKLSDILSSGTSSSRTAAAAATIAAYLGDPKFDGTGNQTNKTADIDDTATKLTDSESASGRQTLLLIKTV